MVGKFIIILLSLIFINSKIPNEDICQQIQCNNQLPDNICIKVEGKISSFKECPAGQICNVEIDDPIFDSQCVSDVKKIKRLPGLSCESDDDCLSHKCEEKKCKGKSKGEECGSVSDCEYGFTCRKDKDDKFKCLEPITTGNECEFDTDCANESGCLRKICTNYFSLDNGQQTRDINNEELSFCKSGYSDELGICQNLTLVNEITDCSSNSECQYQNSDGEIISIEKNCLCGYNPEGTKYCLLGSGNKNYTIYVEKLKNYYIFNQNCHLSERKGEPCQKDLLSDEIYTIKKIHELIHAKYWAKSNNKLINAPECAFKVEMPDYDREIDKSYHPEPVPGKGSCAKYTCNQENNQFCAKSIYQDSMNILVNLNDICAEDLSCQIGGDPNIVFYNKSNTYSKCFSTSLNTRYPGEECEIDSQCIYPLNNDASQFHKCIDGKCNGMEENKICQDNTWCLTGYYCDQLSGKCKEQKKRGDSCFNSKECRNDLICINSKCSGELFSLDEGYKVPENEDPETQRKYCKSVQVYDNHCVKINDNGAKLPDDSYNSCNYGDICYYTVTGLNYIKKLEVSCPCGYNEGGDGFCPHFNEYFVDEWEEYKNIMKDNYDNECHTENRYECYKKKKLESEKEYKNKLEKGHLFNKASDCAKKLLDGSYLSLKKYLILIGVILILF